MPKFAANLTMLFNEVPFLERFSHAAKAGFEGVEFLFPYDFDKETLRSSLTRHGLTQVLHNLPAGVSVTDQGPGISQEMISTVFDRFATGAKSGKRGGAGLGLSIVDSFVNLHNGQVVIDSQPGKGTTVICRIPSANLPSYAAAE